MGTLDFVQAFLNREAIPGVSYWHDDYVRVIAGPYSGSSGSLVTVLSLPPKPRFLLELESGFDVEVLQSEIERAGT
jgi:hypothetical protein